ncbi:hypothetical protein SLS62_004148 [Diatrype stigma]|uniref:Uncharacterized protein n=1 Tax=Diatrype stigma TaxID=117547 RepID=A0AAN9YPD7_9PEZI
MDEVHRNDARGCRTMPLFNGAIVYLDDDMPHYPEAAAQFALLISYPYDEASIGVLIGRSPSEARAWLEAQRKELPFLDYAEALKNGAVCVRSGSPPDRLPHIDVELFFRFDGEVEPEEDDEVGNSCTMAYLDAFFACNLIGNGAWAGRWRPSRGYCAMVALKVLDYLTKGAPESLASSMGALEL